MAKSLSAIFVLLLLLAAPAQKNTMAKYKSVEAYEIRPGILMFPRYSEEGQVCEIGLERRHYSPEKITLYSTLSRKEVDAIVDELAPTGERGPKSKNPLDLMLVVGPGLTTLEQYENITVRIESAVIANSENKSTVDDVAAVITWNQRKCKQAAAAPSSW